MTATGRTWLRAASAAFFALVLAGGIGLGVMVMIRGYSPVPFADFWTQFGFIERARDGDVGLADLWAQHNEHRIALARIQFLLDYGLFEGTNVFLFTAIAVTCIAIAVTFASAVYFETHDLLLALGTLAVGTAATTSPAGWENLTWAFQVQFVQVFLLPVLAVLAIVLASRTAKARRRALLVVGCAVAAIAATYSMANGLLAWPVLVGLAVLLRLERRLLVALSAVGVATVASFLWRFEYETHGQSAPLDVALFVSIYVGSGVWGAGKSAAAIVGALGLLLFVGLFVLAWRRRDSAPATVPFAAGVAAFVVLSAGQTALGRLHLGTSQALASRYSIASFTFWLALLVGFLVPLRTRFHRYPSAGVVYLAGAAVVALIVGIRTIPDPDFQRATRFGREATVLGYRVGVQDFTQDVQGVTAGDVISRALAWMESERLGPFAPGGLVDRVQVGALEGSAMENCRGRVESVVPVDDGRRLRGRIEPPSGVPVARSLVVVDESGKEAGLGLVGERHLEGDWSGFVAYTRNGGDEPLAILLLGEDRATVICRLDASPS